jgi:hypothetical protein
MKKQYLDARLSGALGDLPGEYTTDKDDHERLLSLMAKAGWNYRLEIGKVVRVVFTQQTARNFTHVGPAGTGTDLLRSIMIYTANAAGKALGIIPTPRPAQEVRP